MHDFLDKLAIDAKATVAGGYYARSMSFPSSEKNKNYSTLRQAIETILEKGRKVPIIAELKAASPSLGTIRDKIDSKKIAKAMNMAGAAGISVLTEPTHFNGSLHNLFAVREVVSLPLLMKDIIVSSVQLEAAERTGANSILLIQALFDRGYCEKGLGEMIDEAHERQLEVLLETHDTMEFRNAISSTADLVGINNRNLATLEIDLNTTKRILNKIQKRNKLVISESGIKTPEDIQLLRKCGADGFLVGSAIMSNEDVESKVRELVNA